MFTCTKGSGIMERAKLLVWLHCFFTPTKKDPTLAYNEYKQSWIYPSRTCMNWIYLEYHDQSHKNVTPNI